MALKQPRLTVTMRRAILGSSILGRMYGDGNRHDKTFPALRERGLAEYRDGEGWFLTDKGFELKSRLRTGDY